MTIEFDFVAHDIDGKSIWFAIPSERVDPYSESLRQGPVGFGPMPLIKARSTCLGRSLRIVDVGANIGTVALPLAAHNHDVLAIEAAPVNFAALLAAAAKNRFHSLTPVHVAACAEPCIVNLSSDDAWGFVTKTGTPVYGAPLFDILSAYGFLDADIIKIDIEGYELIALEGIERVIDINPHVQIIYESSSFNARRFGHTVQDLIARFEELGFSNYVWCDTHLMATDSTKPQARVTADIYATRQPDSLDSIAIYPFDLASVERDLHHAANRPVLSEAGHALRQEPFLRDRLTASRGWQKARTTALETVRSNS